MCEFISWINYNDKIYFLTDDEINTPKGQELKKYLGNKYWEDIKGHGAIRYYYDIAWPPEKYSFSHRYCMECMDFSDPNIIFWRFILSFNPRLFTSSAISNPIDAVQHMTEL